MNIREKLNIIKVFLSILFPVSILCYAGCAKGISNAEKISFRPLEIFSESSQTEKILQVPISKEFGERQRYIITFKEKPVGYRDFIVSLGGRVKYDYAIIKGIAIEVPTALAERLRELPNIESIQLDKLRYVSLAQSVPLINADDVQGQGVTGTGVKVCIIDTGVDDSHPALNPLVAEYDFVNNDNDATDDNGHGTHVAGIIASQDSTYKGIAPGAPLMAAKVLDATGSGYMSDVIAGIDWCKNNGADVMNLSLGGQDKYSNYCDSEADVQAVNNAVDAGVVAVVASGNNGWTDGISSPACASGAVSVGATYDADVGQGKWAPTCIDQKTYADKIVCFTNRNKILDLLAPGSVITSTKLGGGFIAKSGTSMAAPHVAGAAALLLQANPNLTPLGVENILKNTGKSIYDAGSGLSFPRIDALAAINFPKLGYLEPYLIEPFTDKTVAQNEFFTFKSGVKCLEGKCGDIRATLNPPKEIAYDDGSAENAWAWTHKGNMWAVRFTPTEYPSTLKTAKFYIYPGWPNPGNNNFNVSIFDDDGSNKAPGTLLGGPINSGSINKGWVEVDLSSLNITISDGDFYVALVQVGDYPNCVGLGTDESGPWAQRSWQRDIVGGQDWQQLASSYGNLMVRTKVSILSTDIGDKPFYTTSSNPQTCTNMQSGDTCEQTWEVKATGDIGTSYEFSALYEPITYASYIASNRTNAINISIALILIRYNFPVDGWYMFSVPLVPENPDPEAVIGDDVGTIFYDWMLARWNPTQETYQYHKASYSTSTGWSQTNDVLPDFSPGLGYWLVTRLGPYNIDAIGTLVAKSDYDSIHLKTGWNQIGNPFNYNVDWANSRVRYEGTVVDIGSPANIWVENKIWWYDGSKYLWWAPGGEGGLSSSQLTPWEGYWVHTFADCDLIISSTLAGEAGAEALSAQALTGPSRISSGQTSSIESLQKIQSESLDLSGSPEWKLQLSVSAGTKKDTYNFAGVSPGAKDDYDALDVLEPPPISTGILLYFPHQDWSFNPGNYTQDIRKSDFKNKEWNFEIKSDLKDTSVSLKWVNLAEVQYYDLSLIDLDADKTIDISNTTEYIYNSGQGGIRHFKLIAQVVAGNGRVNFKNEFGNSFTPNGATIGYYCTGGTEQTISNITTSSYIFTPAPGANCDTDGEAITINITNVGSDGYLKDTINGTWSLSSDPNVYNSANEFTLLVNLTNEFGTAITGGGNERAVFNPGSAWTQATSSAQWSARSAHTSVVYDGKMWIIGGSNKNDVWYSTDGITWTQATSSAQWSARMSHTSVVYDGKMWVIGGADETYRLNDVWYSTDGITWTQATSSAQWSARFSHTSAVYDGKMWVIGGSGSGGKLNDVWYSTDGITWIQATSSAQWSGRFLHTSVVYDNKMWVIGGFDGVLKNDVWYSTDGITWTQATSSAQWSARSNPTLLVYDGKMWIIGGTNKNDVWYSTDGITWTQATSSAQWSGRTAHTSVVYDGKMWVIGGFSGGYYKKDVWYFISLTGTEKSDNTKIGIPVPVGAAAKTVRIAGLGEEGYLRNDIASVSVPADEINSQSAVNSANQFTVMVTFKDEFGTAVTGDGDERAVWDSYATEEKSDNTKIGIKVPAGTAASNVIVSGLSDQGYLDYTIVNSSSASAEDGTQLSLSSANKLILLEVDVSALAEVEINKVFQVEAKIINKGEEKIENAKSEIYLPPGLILLKKDPVQKIGVIPGKKEKKVSWTVKGTERGSYIIIVSASGGLKGGLVSAEDSTTVEVKEATPPGWKHR